MRPILRRPSLTGALQLALVFTYTVVFSVAMPGLWADPFGPLLKNVPILVAISVWMVVEPDR